MQNNDLISRTAFSAWVTELGLNNPKHIDFAIRVVEKLADFPAVDAVVLPCKVGDTVWIVGDKFPAEIEEIRITNDGVFFVYVEYDRGYEETEVWDNGEFQTTDIGKTVFLTNEEAEAALAERMIHNA